MIGSHNIQKLKEKMRKMVIKDKKPRWGIKKYKTKYYPKVVNRLKK